MNPIIAEVVNKGNTNPIAPNDITKAPNAILVALVDLFKYLPAIPIAILPDPMLNNAMPRRNISEKTAIEWFMIISPANPMVTTPIET